MAEEGYIPPLQGITIPSAAVVAGRLAHEGVPVGAISRSLGAPVSDVYESLKYMIEIGAITEMPAADWPPTSKRADHLPSYLSKEPETRQTFVIQRALQLTRLEAAFMLVLLRRDEADKDTLHYVIETQRSMRRSRPDSPETTDPKMVDVIICHMRKKLKPFRVYIKTLWGRGYYLEESSRSVLEQLLARASKVAGAEPVSS